MEVMDRIIELTKRKGITLAKLQSDLGLASGVIYHWKQGKQKPSTDAVIKIADYFNLSGFNSPMFTSN